VLTQNDIYFAGLLPIAGAEAAEASTENEGEVETPAVPDLSSVEGRLDEVSRTVASLAERLPQPEPGPDPVDEATRSQIEAIFGPTPPAQNGEQGQQGQQQGEDDLTFLRELIGEEADKRTRAAVEPLIRQQEAERQQRQAEQRRIKAAELVEEYPDLADREKAAETVSEAREWANEIGRPDLAGEPGFIELVHLAAHGAERAAGETQPGSQPGVTLEGGSGANPGLASTPEAERADAIANAGKQKSVFI
jgi:hypothetical protein